MVEEKDIQNLLNEADEILNECRKNATDNDIFPKEIKVLGKSIVSERIMDSMVGYTLFDNWTTNKNVNNVGIKNINKFISAFIDLRIYYTAEGNIIFDNRFYAVSNVYNIKIQSKKPMLANTKNKNEAETKKIINDYLNKAIKDAEKHVKQLQDIYNSHPQQQNK